MARRIRCGSTGPGPDARKPARAAVRRAGPRTVSDDRHGPPNAAPAELDAYIVFTRRTTSPKDLVRYFQMIATVDVFPMAERVSCPTLILHAGGDTRVPASDTTKLAALIDDFLAD